MLGIFWGGNKPGLAPASLTPSHQERGFGRVLRLLVPWTHLTLYQWGSKTAKDYFCPVCGILPFRRPSDPTSQELREGVEPFDGWAVNVRCLEGVNLEAIPVKKIYGSRIERDS